MKRFFIIAFSSVLWVNSSVASADDTQRTDAGISAPVLDVCQILGVEVAPRSNISVTILPTGANIAFNNFVDPQTSLPQALDLQISINARCNFAHQLNIVSQSGGFGLQNGSGTSSDFATRRDYQTSVNWSGLTGSFNTNGLANQGMTLPLQGAISDTLLLQLTSPAGGRPLVSGSYGDVILVNLSGAP